MCIERPCLTNFYSHSFSTIHIQHFDVRGYRQYIFMHAGKIRIYRDICRRKILESIKDHALFPITAYLITLFRGAPLDIQGGAGDSPSNLFEGGCETKQTYTI